MAEVRDTILAAMEGIAAEHGKTLAPLRDDLPLLDSGLDSLGYAILVARLEGELDVDPFTTAEEFTFPVTLGDFIALYEAAVTHDAAAA
jgi:acyl carrier protein